MATFRVEAYEARGMRESGRPARSATPGTVVRYVRSIFVPEDEVYFHLFEAPSAEAVARVVAAAGLSCTRIAEAAR